MTEQLYQKLKFSNGKKGYVPSVRGSKVIRLFRTADKAHRHSVKLRDRFNRLTHQAKKNGTT